MYLHLIIPFFLFSFFKNFHFSEASIYRCLDEITINNYRITNILLISCFSYGVNTFGLPDLVSAFGCIF